MKIICRLQAVALFLLPVSSFARLGENPEQCDQRYGESVFRNSHGDFEYRSYHFSGRKVQVVFFKSVSIAEYIITGPKKFLGSPQTAEFVREELVFFRGLLSGVYQFTDADLEKLRSNNQRGRNMFNTDRITHGNVAAVFSVAESDRQDAARCMGVVVVDSIPRGAERLLDFYDESHNLDLQKQEQDRATGF